MAKLDPQKVTCNLCGSSFATASSVALVKDGLTIVRCPGCELLFRASLPTASEVPDLYGSEYFRAADGSLGHEGYLDYVGDAEVHRLNARRRLRRLAALARPGTLLDVGCAAGFFVEQARLSGWDARGIDVSEPMIAWGREHIGDLEVATLQQVDRRRSETCITMWDYIEHTIDPRGDLERAYDLIEPGGLLALSTGDASSLLARASLTRWHLMTPRHHNFFFSTDTMRLLLREVGFDVAYVGRPGAVFPLRYLGHKACMAIDVRPATAVATRLERSRLGALRLPVNLWDVMTVIARRPHGAADTVA